MDKNIVLAGFGGQGILFAGKVLAYTGMIDELHVSWLPSYGPEMRGGTANCSVCISENEIGSPRVLDPNILIVMNIQSYDRFIDTVVDGGAAVVNSTLINKKTDNEKIRCVYIPATEMANDNNLQGLANIICLGAMLKQTGMTSYDSMEAAIKKCVPPSKAHLLDANLKALKLGYEFEG
ncbi:MAG: 2-oxoacid:ferredoxin oxidoreductase subunit gamma [Oscillospiraceae bacterium]|nr:2-oxoacid:ferredoxin oxidoreductase subunit gamma [Oscillospiraceae bacterium]